MDQKRLAHNLLFSYTLSIKICKGFKCGQGAFDAFGWNTVGNTHMSWCAKSSSWYNKQVEVFCFFTEGNIIRNQGSWEDIEGTLRLYHVVAKLS